MMKTKTRYVLCGLIFLGMFLSGLFQSFAEAKMVFASFRKNKKFYQQNNARLPKSQGRSVDFRLSEIPRHLASDLKESVWGFGALGLAAGAGLAAIVHVKDQELSASWQKNRVFHAEGNRFFDLAGSPVTLGALSFGLFLGGHALERPKLKKTGEALLEALVLSQASTWGLKLAFDRRRPNGESHSFPSAHASASFATATVLQSFYGAKMGVPAYAFASLVSVSRLDSKDHFLSDVLFGAALGTVMGYGTARFHKKHTHHWTFIPEFGAGRTRLHFYHAF